MNNDVSATGTIAVFVVIVLAIVGGGWLLLASRPDPIQLTINPPVPTSTPAPTATPQPVVAYITGAVQQPQMTLTLPFGSRVQDALDAAGGTLPDADLTRVNVVALVRDGDQIHVPTTNDAALNTDDVAALPTRSGGDVVYINTASLEELQTLPGVGPALAQNIIDYREANGSITDEAAFDEVSGIGPATLEELRSLISFE